MARTQLPLNCRQTQRVLANTQKGEWHSNQAQTQRGLFLQAHLDSLKSPQFHNLETSEGLQGKAGKTKKVNLWDLAKKLPMTIMVFGQNGVYLL